jgi:putative ABC transport system permease protein
MDKWKLAARSLSRRPAVMIPATLVLGLGVAAATAMCVLGDSLYLRPLPWSGSGRVVMIQGQHGSSAGWEDAVSPADFVDFSGSTRSFEKTAAWIGLSKTMLGGKFPEVVHGAACSPELFSLLDVGPERGRFFEASDTGVAVISDGLWRRQFDAREDIVGSVKQLDGKAYRIVGVLPSDKAYPQGTEIWLPLNDSAPLLGIRGMPLFSAMGRLSPGVSMKTAREEATLIAGRLQAAHPGADKGLRLSLQPFRDSYYVTIKPIFHLLLGAAGVLLALGCINLLLILLADAADRRRDVAIQVALGAEQRHLRMQSLREGVLLTLTGAAFGALLAPLMAKVIGLLLPATFSVPTGSSFSFQTAAFACGISTLCGLSCCVLPKQLLTRKADVSASLQAGSTSHSGGRSSRAFWLALMTVEVALTTVLCCEAALLFKSFERLAQVPLGFTPQNLLAVRVHLPSVGYPDGTRRIAAVEELRSALARIPGVQSIGLTTFMPLGGVATTSPFEIPDQFQQAHRQGKSDLQVVDPSYFSTMRIHLLEGRFFSVSDKQGGPLLCMVNQAFARQYFGLDSPIGKVIRVGQSPDSSTVVGVVGDARQDLDAMPRPILYLAFAQFPPTEFDIVVRTLQSPAEVSDSARRAVWAVDPQLPVLRTTTMDVRLQAALLSPSMRSRFMVIYAGLCVLLAVAGLYAVVSYIVRRRYREIAIRIAVGATPSQVFRWVVKIGVAPLVSGVVLGILLTMFSDHLIAAFLYAVSPRDVPTFAVVGLFILVVGVLPLCVPAWRALKLDPSLTLRTF